MYMFGYTDLGKSSCEYSFCFSIMQFIKIGLVVLAKAAPGI